MIKLETTINEIVLQYPAALGPLSHHGLDTCCQAHKTLAAAASGAGLDPQTLIAEITAVVEAK